MALALNELISVYGVPAGWDVGASVYRRLWAHLPGDVLRSAILAHMAVSDWFPKPAQILAHAAEEMGWYRDDLERARQQRLPTPEERRIAHEEVEALMAKYREAARDAWATPIPVRPVTPRYVVDEVPETIAGKPWR